MTSLEKNPRKPNPLTPSLERTLPKTLPKISGFTLIRNGVQFDYPFLESIRSLLPLVDQLVINVGQGDDDTLEKIQALAKDEPKILLFESNWGLDDPEKKRGGQILSEQTNLALDRCTGDWCLYLQADEVLHEEDYLKLRNSILACDTHPEIEALLFDYVHFYGSYDVIQLSRSAYRREVRAIRRSAQLRSVGDAQSFKHPDGQKPHATHSHARVFHYGWVRPPEVMREKTFFMDQLYHGDPTQKNLEQGIPHTGDNYRYKKIWGLREFKKTNQTHPAVMKDRIASKNWHWDLSQSPWVFSSKDISKVILDLFERATGMRLFEYQSYKQVKAPSPSTPLLPLQMDQPKASLLISTYELPHHLALVCAGLEKQSETQVEVFICDDGSGEETAKIIRDFKIQAPFPVYHLWQENKGFRKCEILNKALRQAKGALCIFLDGDCVPHRHYIRDHLTYSTQGHYLAGRRVEIGPRLSKALTPEKVRSGFFNYPHLEFILSIFRGDSEYLNRSIRITWPKLRSFLNLNQVEDLKGCNYSVSRKDLISINGFDENYQGYGREDTDVEIRLQNLGLKIKSLKGAALQFHIWHPRRDFTASNEARIEDTKRTGKVRCKKGLEG